MKFLLATLLFIPALSLAGQLTVTINNKTSQPLYGSQGEAYPDGHMSVSGALCQNKDDAVVCIKPSGTVKMTFTPIIYPNSPISIVASQIDFDFADLIVGMQDFCKLGSDNVCWLSIEPGYSVSFSQREFHWNFADDRQMEITVANHNE